MSVVEGYSKTMLDGRQEDLKPPVMWSRNNRRSVKNDSISRMSELRRKAGEAELCLKYFVSAAPSNCTPFQLLVPQK